MELQTGRTAGAKGNEVRIAGWSLAAGLLLLPLVAMQFTEEVAWGPEDFVFAVVLIGGTGGLLELAARMSRNWFYRAGAALALGAGFLMVWANAAVGLIGSENDDANALFFGVLAVGLAGAGLSRLRAGGMARTMAAMATAQIAVAILAFAAGLGNGGALYPVDILGVTAVFGGMWALSGLLFRQAAREA